MHWTALLLAVIANVIANVGFKIGVQEIAVEARWGVLLTEPWLLVGALATIATLFCYLYALRGIALSVAYPSVIGLSMLGIALAGSWIFSEPIGVAALFGIALVIGGVVLMSSARQT